MLHASHCWFISLEKALSPIREGYGSPAGPFAGLPTTNAKEYLQDRMVR